MGWTSMHRESGQSTREFLESEFFRSGEYRLVDCVAKNAATQSGVIYAAVETVATGEVWGLVVLTKWTRDYYNFTYKEIEEGQGPYESDCPTHILDKLTPTTSQWANEWRQRCRENAAKRISIHVGDTVRLAKPVQFTNGAKLETVTKVRRGNRFYFSSPDAYGLYNLPRWALEGATRVP